jgi:hypothetical protein
MSTGSDCRSEGVQHQGLVDDHRYQARPCLACPGRSRLSQGTAVPPRSTTRKEPTACHRARSFEAGKASPAKPAQSHALGQAARTPQLPARRGVLTTERPKGRAQRAQHHSTTVPPAEIWVGGHLIPGVDASTGPTRGHRFSPPAATRSPHRRDTRIANKALAASRLGDRTLAHVRAVSRRGHREETWRSAIPVI